VYKQLHFPRTAGMSALDILQVHLQLCGRPEARLARAYRMRQVAAGRTFINEDVAAAGGGRQLRQAVNAVEQRPWVCVLMRVNTRAHAPHLHVWPHGAPLDGAQPFPAPGVLLTILRQPADDMWLGATRQPTATAMDWRQ
jgi:hypothetical protein